jgi:phage recombination protein Bet
VAEQNRAVVAASPNGLAPVDSATRELVRRTVFPGSNDDELEVFLYDCQRQGVHPLDRMIHPIIRTDSKGARRYSPVTSIDLFRARAGSTGEHAGTDDTVFFSPEDKPGPYPAEATVTVYRFVKGQRCAFTATARWTEYYPGDGPSGMMWRKMPHTMLSKVCESLALRKAFPAQLGGIYVREEMDQDTGSDPEARDPRRNGLKGVMAEASKSVAAVLDDIPGSTGSMLDEQLDLIADELGSAPAGPTLEEFATACKALRAALRREPLVKKNDKNEQWFVDMEVVTAAGLFGSQLVMRDGNYVLNPEIGRILLDEMQRRLAAARTKAGA